MGSPQASDVAREAADIIILDDDFCSIVNAIREGRLLFDNLKKSIAYTLTHLVPEMVPVFINIILRFPLGLSSLLILTIDLGSELVPAISLAYEEPESAIMMRPPRSTKTDRMVTGPLIFYSYCVAGVVESVASFLAFFCVFWSHGIDLSDLMAPVGTVYWISGAPDFVSRGNTFSSSDQVSILSVGNAACYANIVLCQIFHIWFCRTRMTSVTQHSLFSNKLTMFAMPWELAFIAILCYIPQLTVVFTSGVGLPIQFWCLSLGFLLWVALHTETVKYYARRKVIQGKSSCVAWMAW
jgi:sodium/potassium-transporting ATPase subunit alpha